MNIPLVDLKIQYQSLKPEIDAAVGRILESTQFVLGDEVAAFEREFAAYSGAAIGVAANSGTSALHLALLAAGVGPGDEVITVPFTFIATAAAISYTGATPVFVDIEPRYFTMDPAAVEAAITPRTKAIMPVHLYGQCVDMDPILEMAARRGLVVIEDAAQAHGAEYRGRRAGSMGALAGFSFYPGKNLGAYGEGGLTTTGDEGMAARMRMLRDWGQPRKYEHAVLGYNYRMEGMQGAILRVKLRRLEDWTEARRRIGRAYTAALAEAGVGCPEERPNGRHVYHVYAVRSSARDALRDHLVARGVGVGIHYPIPVHLQQAYAHLGHRSGDFPESERAANEVLSLPIYPELSDDQMHAVVEAVRAFGAASR